jgi:arsenate reductase (glutaredoxin)
MLFGISNCDTVKRARAWLAEKAVPYVFWDYKKHGVPADWLQNWLPILGWQQLVNTRGTTWRKLDEATRQGVTDEASALALMLAQPSVIKRPLMHWRTPASLSIPQPSLSLGFDADHWNTLL